MLTHINSDRIILTIVIASILLIVPEVHSMSPITAFGQIPFLSDQPSSSSTNNQSNLKAPNYSSNASLTGINSTGNTTHTNSGGKGSSGGGNINNLSSNDKVVILTFDDNRKGDFTYAKPILDKYGFKATFFIICNETTDKGAMNWQDIAAMHNDGMDIESHTMTHPNLDNLSQSQLDFEIGGSKQCLANHGYHATTFAYPYNAGSKNATVVNTVAKYYDMARSGSEPLMFLNCQGFMKHTSLQTDCRTYSSDGRLTYANRYAVRSYTVDVLELKDSFDNATIYSDFVNEVNSQSNYNHAGRINAVPLITFHDVGLETNKRYTTNVDLFDQLMKYLYDNGFKVLTFEQLGYNTNTNTFYLRGSS
jgi:peptidoglycan/xylan/chitin deacetylase (PgdA/CDA1 family)